jgi:hypothetical protein
MGVRCAAQWCGRRSAQGALCGCSPAVAGYVYSFRPLRRFPVSRVRAELVGDCSRELPPARGRGRGDRPGLLLNSCSRARALLRHALRRDRPNVTGPISIASSTFRSARNLKKDHRVLQADGWNTEESFQVKRRQWEALLHTRSEIGAVAGV